MLQIYVKLATNIFFYVKCLPKDSKKKAKTHRRFYHTSYITLPKYQCSHGYVYVYIYGSHKSKYHITWLRCLWVQESWHSGGECQNLTLHMSRSASVIEDSASSIHVVFSITVSHVLHDEIKISKVNFK